MCKILAASGLIWLLLQSSVSAQTQQAEWYAGFLYSATDSARVQILNALCVKHRQQGNYRLADSLAQAALSLAEAISYKQGIAQALDNIGTVAFVRGRYRTALANYQKALALKHELGDQRGIANTLANIAVLYRSEGKYADALDFHLQALRLFEQTGDQRGIANAYDNLAQMYQSQGEYDNALAYYQRAMDIKEKVGDKWAVAVTEDHIGNLYLTQRKYAEAIDYHIRALKLRAELGDKSGMAASFSHIADIYEQQGKYLDALDYLFTVLKLRTDMGDMQGLPSTLLNIGRIYRLQNRLQDALSYTLKGLDAAKSINAKPELKDAYHQLYMIHMRMKNTAEALAAYTQYAAYKDSIFTTQSAKRFAELKEYYEAEQRQKEIELLQRDKELQQAAIREKEQSIALLEKSQEIKILQLKQRDVKIKLMEEKRLSEVAQLEKEKIEQELKIKQQEAERERQSREIELLAKTNKVKELEAERQRLLFIGGISVALLVIIGGGVVMRQQQQAAKALAEKTKLIEKQNLELIRQKAIVERQRDELAEANKLKNEFLAIAAHDLKNPLQTVMGFASLLSEEETQPDEAKEMANIITRSSQRMYKLITDLLEVAAQEAGKTQLEKSFVNLSELLTSVVEENLPNAKAKAQTLHLETEPQLLVEVDSMKIRQVFDNLISNAIKYSPHGKNITVSCQRRIHNAIGANGTIVPTAYVQVAIKDEGQGLSEDDMKNLFGKFKRLSAKPTGGESSTGLGLSIAKQLVELHGGRIWAESEGKGKGATFFVELPVSSQNQERFLPNVPSSN